MPRKLVDSMGHALRGLYYSFRTQRNLKIHICAAILALIAGYFLKISAVEFAVIFLVIALVILLELINTAIEEVVNMLLLTRKMRAMVAKDVSAAAVLVASAASVAVGICIFLPKIMNIISGGRA